MRGRKPKPRILKIVQGTYRKDRAKNEPAPELIAPPCPRWLPRKAKNEWSRLAPQLEELGLLTQLDGPMFAGYCATVARWRQAEERLAKEGLTILGEGGQMKSHPCVRIATQAAALMLKFGSDFGLTPTSRSRIDLPAPPKKSLRDRLMEDREARLLAPEPRSDKDEGEPDKDDEPEAS
jgi:P27 family predicted phage terminase small subunit